MRAYYGRPARLSQYQRRALLQALAAHPEPWAPLAAVRLVAARRLVGRGQLQLAVAGPGARRTQYVLTGRGLATAGQLAAQLAGLVPPGVSARRR